MRLLIAFQMTAGPPHNQDTSTQEHSPHIQFSDNHQGHATRTKDEEPLLSSRPPAHNRPLPQGHDDGAACGQTDTTDGALPPSPPSSSPKRLDDTPMSSAQHGFGTTKAPDTSTTGRASQSRITSFSEINSTFTDRASSDPINIPDLEGLGVRDDEFRTSLVAQSRRSVRPSAPNSPPPSYEFATEEDEIVWTYEEAEDDRRMDDAQSAFQEPSRSSPDSSELVRRRQPRRTSSHHQPLYKDTARLTVESDPMSLQRPGPHARSSQPSTSSSSTKSHRKSVRERCVNHEGPSS